MYIDTDFILDISHFQFLKRHAPFKMTEKVAFLIRNETNGPTGGVCFPHHRELLGEKIHRILLFFYF